MDTQDKIRDTVASHPVVLYMKGSPQFPMCGFSASAIQILKANGIDKPFTVDILQDEEIRQGHQGIRQLADHSTTVCEWRIYWRCGHPARNASVG